MAIFVQLYGRGRTHKDCPKCGLFRTRDKFYTNRTRDDGLSDWCKKCTNADKRRRQGHEVPSHLERTEQRRVKPRRY